MRGGGVEEERIAKESRRKWGEEYKRERRGTRMIDGRRGREEEEE